MRTLFATLPTCLFLLSAPIWVQEYTTQPDSLYSTHLGEQRQVNVAFPEQHDPDLKNSYDVFYVLDGEWNTSLSETVLHFLGYGQFVPIRVMIVSLLNQYESETNRRGRDFKEMGIAKFKRLLSKKALKELHWQVATYPNETHFSAIWKGLYDGLKFTYVKSEAGKKIVNRANAAAMVE